MRRNAKWQLWLLWLTGAFGSLSSMPAAQTFGVGMSSMADIISNGAVVRNVLGISSDLFNGNSKSELSTGKAVAEERRRRKRQLFGEENLLPLNNAEHPHQHRGKRSPCHTVAGSGGTGGGQLPNPNPVGDGTDYTDVVERRRKQRKRNATQRKKTRSTSKKTKRKVVSRRRRQAIAEGDFFDETGKKISDTVQEFANSMKSFMGSMMSMAQSVHQTVNQAVQETFKEPK